MQLITVRDMQDDRYAQCIRVRQHVLYADEPEAIGGRDAGPAPYDFLLVGLGACTAITLKMYALRRGLDLHHTTVELRYEARQSEGARLDYFHRVIHLEGNLTGDGRMELLRAAEHCPVSQTLRRSSVIQTELADTNPDSSGDILEIPTSSYRE
jgi:putative redox protein